MQTGGQRPRINTNIITQRPQIITTKDAQPQPQGQGQVLAKGPSSNPSPPAIIIDKKQKTRYKLSHFLGEVTFVNFFTFYQKLLTNSYREDSLNVTWFMMKMIRNWQQK